MPLSPDFSISQSAISPNLVTATDLSTGSDVAIVARHIYFETAAGTYLVEEGTTTDYNLWALANTTQTFNVLTVDKAVNVIVNWVDINGDTLYTLDGLFCLREYNKQFLVYLGQQQAIRPDISNDFHYSGNLSVYYAYVKYANKMITVGADIRNSQNLLDKATYMRLNQTKFFGN